MRSERAPRPGLCRRSFLRATGWSALGLTVVSAGCRLPVIPARPDPSVEDALAWVQVTGDGQVRFHSPRQEMGQGAVIGLLQVVAEELGVPPERIETVIPSTQRAPVARATVGSESIMAFAEPVARAAATLREALGDRAAAALGVPRAEVMRTPKGDFTSPGRADVTIGALVDGPALVLEPNAQVELRYAAPGPKRWLGRDVPEPDLVAIVTGAPRFASDVRRDGMVHGQVVPPPRFGARLGAVDATAARAVRGVVAVVEDRDEDFVGIVATSVGAIIEARRKLSVEWRDGSRVSDADIIQTLGAVLDEGDLEHELIDEGPETDGAWDVDLRLDVPMAAHAALEPRVAVADVSEDGRAELWVGHQDPFYVRDAVADLLGASKDDVIVHPQRIGGAFGGKTLCTVELQAVRLSRAVGRPVRVQWTRGDEHAAAFSRPPARHRVRARVKDGQIVDWWHGVASGHVIFSSAALPGWLQTLTSFLPDKGAARGLVPPYRGRGGATRRRVEMSDVRIDPPTGPWRGLGAASNHLAIERAMDQLARRAGVDPITFRLDNLPATETRLRGCLEAARRWSSAWAGPGLGVAAGVYKDMTPVACVAQVVRTATGGLRVARIGVAQDCGPVFSPDRVRAQIEGNVVWSIGMVLVEALRAHGGRLDAEDFARYPIPRMADAPQIEIEMLDAEAGPPTGAAESAMSAAPGAIFNAACALLGEDLSQVPVAGFEVAPT